MGNKCCPSTHSSDSGNFQISHDSSHAKRPTIIKQLCDDDSPTKHQRNNEHGNLSTNISNLHDGGSSRVRNVNQLKVLTRFLTQEPDSSSHEEDGVFRELPSPDYAISIVDSTDIGHVSVDTKFKLSLYEYEDGTKDETGQLASFRVLATGQIYRGQWKHGKRHGRGESYDADGSVYKGLWVDNKKEGRGKMIWSDGKVYTGEWKDDQMHGKGELIFPNGSKYKGDFVEGIRTGNGEFEWANKSKYSGPWKDDKMDGEGLYTSPTGQSKAVLWKNGERIKWF